jgi:signal transduction histidine kinase
LGHGGSLVESRQRLLDVVCWVGCIFGVPVCAGEIWVNTAVGRWDLIALSGLVGLCLAALPFGRRLKYTVRATAFCAVMGVAAGATWLLGGFVLDSAAVHMTAILLSVLLLGRRAAVVVLLVLTAMFVVAAYGHYHGWLPTDPQIEAAGHSAQNWVTGGAILTATAILVAMGMSIVLRNIEGARRVAVHLSTRLALESEARLLEIQRREETQRLLVASQRREALAMLAGGLAHDFNNLLTVVYYAFEQSELEVRAGGPAAEALALGRSAAESTAALTRQLLAYSRGDPQGKTPLDLAPVLRTTCALIRRLLPQDITLRLDSPETLPHVVCAPTQIQQVLLNLAVNARDAMSHGGEVVIVVRIDNAAVELRVTDTGTGIDPAIAERIFEPLFTTKAVGQGTGLGLAVVASVISDHGGTISVQSRPGVGTTFEVRLPRSTAGGERVPVPAPVPAAAKRRLLVVDDEEAVRLVAARVLRARGFDVTVYASADEAMRAIDAALLPDLIVTDLSMPGTSGAVFARRMLAAYETLRVLVISGFGADVELTDVLATGRAAVLVKPFTAQSLGEAVAALGIVAGV